MVWCGGGGAEKRGWRRGGGEEGAGRDKGKVERFE